MLRAKIYTDVVIAGIVGIASLMICLWIIAGDKYIFGVNLLRTWKMMLIVFPNVLLYITLTTVFCLGRLSRPKIYILACVLIIGSAWPAFVLQSL